MKWFYLFLVLFVMVVGGILLMLDEFIPSAVCFVAAMIGGYRFDKKGLLPQW